MGLKRGYKQTEIGVIPEEWDTHPCSELSERIMVGIVIRPAQYYVRHGVPAFRSANIRVDGINESDLVFISEASNSLLAKSQTRTGDVLTVRTGYPGTSAVVRSAHAGCNCIDILITRPSKKLNSEWLAIWINSSFGKEQVLRNQGGLAQKHFNVGDMKNLVVALPHLSEQEAIAAALSDADALIESLEQLLAKKRQFKQGAMQELLTGRRRFPGFSDAWSTEAIEDVCEINTGSKNTQDRVSDGQFPFFVRSQTIERINSYSFDGEAVLTAGDGVGTGKVFHYVNGKFDVHQRVYRMAKFCPRVSGYFFYLYFSTQFYDRIMQMTAKSSVDSVRREMIAKMHINLPSREEQDAIVDFLVSLSAEITSLEEKRLKVRSIKQGMMQQLLTGKIRLV